VAENLNVVPLSSSVIFINNTSHVTIGTIMKVFIAFKATVNIGIEKREIIFA